MKKISLYFLLICLSLTASYARVIFRTANITSGGIGSYQNVDFNLDGVNDVVFQLHSYNVPAAPGVPYPNVCGSSPLITVGRDGFEEKISVYGLNGTNSYTSGSAALVTNTLVGPNSNFSTSLGMLWGEARQEGVLYNSMSQCYTSYNPTGPIMHSGLWALLPNGGYLGIKFKINGIIHYGYVKFSVIAGSAYPAHLALNQFSIVEIAYESIPGFPIKTGDKVGYMSDSFNPTANIIRGKVYVDANSNCSYNIGEKGIENIIVSTTTGNYAGITDNNGNYEIYVPGGSSSYSLDIASPYAGSVTKICPNSALAVSLSGNNQISQNNNFSITMCSKLITNIVSNRRRLCFRNDTYVNYSNIGIINSPTATLKVVMPEYVKPISSTPAWNSVSGDTLIYSLGSIAAFSNGLIRITDSVSCFDDKILNLVQCTQAIITPFNYCNASLSWDHSDLMIEGACMAPSFQIKITNIGSAMSDSTTYKVFLDETIVKQKNIKLSSGEKILLNINPNGRAVRVEVNQNPYHPELPTRSISYEGCGNFIVNPISKSIINKSSTNQGGLQISTHCVPIRGSYDPNDKSVSPAGIGANHAIVPNELNYTIRFQNTGNDTAYTVVVADTLDANLDLNTLRVIGNSHPFKLEITGSTSPRLAWIFGGINLPDSTTNEPASNGFIHFTISPKTGLANGTVIKNKAYIFFDYNSAIITNEVSNTIGLTYPQNILQITSQPVTATTCVNVASSLSSAGNGLGTLKYQWYKDNNLLVGQTNSNLNFTSPLLSDAGNYKCRIENEIDTLYTSTIPFNVSDIIPDIQVTNPNPICSTVSIDLSTTFTDNNNTTGNVTYWSDNLASTVLPNPTSINTQGTYYIKKQTSEGCSDIKPVVVTVNTCNSTLEEIQTNLGVKLYPNPVIEKMSIESKYKVGVSIIDFQGKIVYQNELIGSNSIDMKGLMNGNYFVLLKKDSQTYSIPIIKQ